MDAAGGFAASTQLTRRHDSHMRFTSLAPVSLLFELGTLALLAGLPLIGPSLFSAAVASVCHSLSIPHVLVTAQPGCQDILGLILSSGT